MRTKATVGEKSEIFTFVKILDFKFVVRFGQCLFEILALHLFSDLCFEFGKEFLVALDQFSDVFLALSESLSVVIEPRAALIHDTELDREVDDLGGF